MSNDAFVYSIERPHSKLMVLYLIRSILTGPLVVLTLPVLYFRYHTMRYRFDGEGVSMRWGILFRHEVNLAYTRIQDIHVTSGPILRWLGLAELHIQTASGSATAEMTIEGICEYEVVREFLYTRMRGYRKAGMRDGVVAPAQLPAGSVAAPAEVVKLLEDIRQEMRGAREALEQLPRGERPHV